MFVLLINGNLLALQIEKSDLTKITRYKRAPWHVNTAPTCIARSALGGILFSHLFHGVIT